MEAPRYAPPSVNNNVNNRYTNISNRQLDPYKIVSQLTPLDPENKVFHIRPIDGANQVPSAHAWKHTPTQTHHSYSQPDGGQSTDENEGDPQAVPNGATVEGDLLKFLNLYDAGRGSSLNFQMIIFIHNLQSTQTRDFLLECRAMNLFENIKRKKGLVLCITSETEREIHQLIEETGPLKFPIIRDPSCVLASHFRIFVDKDPADPNKKVSRDGVIIRARIYDKLTNKCNAATLKEMLNSEVEDPQVPGFHYTTVYHYHSSARPLTKKQIESKTNFDEKIVYVLRAPIPHTYAIKYGFGPQAFRNDLPFIDDAYSNNNDDVELDEYEQQLLKNARSRRNAYKRKESKVKFDSFYRIDTHDEEFDGEPDPNYAFLTGRPSIHKIWCCLLLILSNREEKNEIRNKQLVLKESALRRLKRDFKECIEYPLPNVTACFPYDNNIFEWHANIKGVRGTPYDETNFHLIFYFKPTYPLSPPRVDLCTPLIHANVFSSYICLNMLTDFAVDQTQPTTLYTGWSTAYSVQSILIQLQAFLFEGAAKYRIIDEDRDYPTKEYDKLHNKKIKNTIMAARNFRCPCGHEGRNPYPAYVTDNEYRKKKKENYYIHSNQLRRRQREEEEGANQNPLHSFLLKNSINIQPSNNNLANIVINNQKNNSVVSDFFILGNDSKYKPTSIDHISNISIGSIITGRVNNIKEYGAFLDIGLRTKSSAMCHVSRMRSNNNNSYVYHAGDVLKLNDVVKVQVINIELDKNRISLQLVRSNQIEGNGSDLNQNIIVPRYGSGGSGVEGKPNNIKYLNLNKTPVENLSNGMEFTGRIITVDDALGLFIDFGCVVKGLIPLSHLIQVYRPRHFWQLSDFLSSGKQVKVSINRINRDYDPPRINLDLLLSENEKKQNLEIASNNFLSGCGGVSMDMYIDADPPTKLREQRALKNSYFTLLLDSSNDTIITDFIFAYLDKVDVYNMSLVCHLFSRKLNDLISGYFYRKELICFHSKINYKYDTLGFPLNVERYENSGEICYLHPQLNLISEKVYKQDSVRRGVWKAPFTDFFPLYFNKRHAKDLVPHEKYIAELCRLKHEKQAHHIRPFHPSMVLKVIPTLMNTMIVSMMKGDVHESIAAISGYTQLFHLLLAFSFKYPEIITQANARISKFCSSEYGRSKRECPNLGEFLPLLTISDYSWNDVVESLLSEVMDRNARWVCEKYKELKDVQPISSEQTLDGETQALLREYGVEYVPRSKEDEKKEKMLKELNEHQLKIIQRRAFFKHYQTFGSIPIVKEKEKEKEKTSKADKDGDDNEIEPGAEDNKNEGEDEEGEAEGEEGDEDTSSTANTNEGLDVDSEDEEEKEKEKALFIESVNEANVNKINELDRGRVPKSFRACKVSYRLVLFHVFFMNSFKGIRGDGTRPTNLEIFEMFNIRYGRCSPALELHFQKSIFSLRKVRTWEDFFKKVQLSVPSQKFLLTWLRTSIFNAVRRRYFRCPQVNKLLQEYNQRNNNQKPKKKAKGPSLGFESLADFDEDGNPVKRSHSARKALAAIERMEYEATKKSRDFW